MHTIHKDNEKVLLGNWLLGDHLEDLDMFQPYHFPTYGSLVYQLKAGERDFLQLSKKSVVSVIDINDLMHYHMDALYEVAVLNMQKQLADEWIQQHPEASPEEVSENMKRFTKMSGELPAPSRDPVDSLIEELNRRKEEQMVSTGLKDLDRMLCGVRTKELTAVGARPSVGKSALIQQIAVKVAEQGKKVLFFPLEMSEMAIMQRMVMRYSDIPQNEIRNGLSAATWERSAYGFSQVNDFIEQGNFLIFERVNDLPTIKRLIELHKPYMIVIDQLEQLDDNGKVFPDKRMRFSHMTHELQAISLDMDVAVWFACQINRAADNTPPTMANLKESGTIEEDATNVLLLHREGDKTALQSMTLELAKQKDGECGTIGLMFDAPHFNFLGVDRRN